MQVQDRPKKKSIVGVDISTTHYDEVVGYVRKWVNDFRTNNASLSARYVCVTSVHGIISAQDENVVGKILNDADIATPDGMPLVWALRSFGVKGQQRVYGPTLMLHLCEDAALHGHRIYLYGGREESLKELRSKLSTRFPSLQIAGSYSPPFRPLTVEENERVEEQINLSKADIVFVGISTPKQEKWMYAHRDKFPGLVLIGVGAAFDFHAGRVKQAPSWMQQYGLEWCFRLMMEPGRLWRRYLLVTPRFIPLWAMQHLRLATGLSGSRTTQR